MAVIYDDGQMSVALTYNLVMIVAGKISSLIAGHSESPDVIGVCLEPNQFVPAVLIGAILQDLDMVLVKLNRPQHLRTERTSLAYCITTSGTTGSPKIVIVPHSCIVPDILNQRRTFRISEEDVVFLSSPFAFDPSIVDIFVTLSSGSCLLMTSDAMKAVPNRFLWLLTKYHVCVMQCTPTLLTRFSITDLHTSLLSEYSALRVLGFRGEQFPPLSHLQQQRAPGNRTKFYNVYGITEVSCWSSMYEVTESDLRDVIEDVPLGKPMIDTDYIVKDNNGKVIKKGQGYLYIGSLNRIYLINDEDRQAVQGKVLRPTGDLVNTNSQSQIIYIGRTDCRIKRYGKRIDLTEIEQVACMLKRIKTCKILYKESILVAVVEERSDKDTSWSFSDLGSEVKAQIEDCLPAHYWLDKVVRTDEMPMTNHVINGEVKEEAMFIFSGRNSVQAVQLSNRIQADLNIQLPWLLDFILHKGFGEIIKEIIFTIDVPSETPSTKNTNGLSLHEKWMYNTGKCVDTSPLIASLSDGRMAVFIGPHSHKLSAVLFGSGQLLWETTLGKRI
ncbi:AASDH [Mytilus coruscus]|uniref:AASDH n=1 Tax=Mytilus coruscus TaxID=42192 RepID=A0A6J8EWD8_MYTCO|nr:AASDH [Mytilus coruscus]